jgi:hypothetical protein
MLVVVIAFGVTCGECVAANDEMRIVAAAGTDPEVSIAIDLTPEGNALRFSNRTIIEPT